MAIVRPKLYTIYGQLIVGMMTLCVFELVLFCYCVYVVVVSLGRAAGRRRQ